MTHLELKTGSACPGLLFAPLKSAVALHWPVLAVHSDLCRLDYSPVDHKNEALPLGSWSTVAGVPMAFTGTKAGELISVLPQQESTLTERRGMHLSDRMLPRAPCRDICEMPGVISDPRALTVAHSGPGGVWTQSESSPNTSCGLTAPVPAPHRGLLRLSAFNTLLLIDLGAWQTQRMLCMLARARHALAASTAALRTQVCIAFRPRILWWTRLAS